MEKINEERTGEKIFIMSNLTKHRHLEDTRSSCKSSREREHSGERGKGYTQAIFRRGNPTKDKMRMESCSKSLAIREIQVKLQGDITLYDLHQ